MSTGLRPATLLLAPFLVLIAACGGGDDTAETEEAAVPVEEVPPARYRDSLTMADLGVLERDDILVAMPWSTNRISRNPDVGPTGSTVLERVEVTPERGFDRIQLYFGERIPGFTLHAATEPIVACSSGEAREIAGEEALFLRLQGTTAHDEEGRSTVGDRNRVVSQDALASFVMTCDVEGTVEVGLGVTGPVEWRVLEMGNEPLLVLDVRRREGGAEG